MCCISISVVHCKGFLCGRYLENTSVPFTADGAATCPESQNFRPIVHCQQPGSWSTQPSIGAGFSDIPDCMSGGQGAARQASQEAERTGQVIQRKLSLSRKIFFFFGDQGQTVKLYFVKFLSPGGFTGGCFNKR